jgi:hypothetical protein
MRRRRDIFRAGFPAPTRPSTYSRRDARHAGRSDRAWLLDTGDGAGNHFIKPAPARHKCSIRQVNMTISLAFLAPELVRQPSRDDCLAASASLGCAMLRDARFVDLIRRRSAKEVQHYGVQPMITVSCR